ncbi:MAG: endonuclease/exonuclease/phosphatase family protein [Desulfomonilia bacterium]
MKTTINKVLMVSFLAVFLVAPLFISSTASAGWFDSKVKVMTQNLYLGADIFKVVDAAENPDPAKNGLDVPIAVAEIFQTVQYTNFPERAEAIANQIWFHRPHLIGLQEVSIFYTQSPGDFLTVDLASDPPLIVNPDHDPAEDVVYDFLAILLNALSARGLNYVVAVEGDNADVEVPMLTGFTTITIPGPTGPIEIDVPTFDDVRLVDRDVILVRSDVAYENAVAANYGTNLSQPIAGVELEFTRGWVGADVTVDGGTYRFVNTHLEVRSSPYSIFRVVQSAQMQELLTILSYEPKPIILVGDFNNSPEDVPGLGYYPEDLDEDGMPLPDAVGIPYVPPYMFATDPNFGFGYLMDAWDLLFFPRDGFTSGFSETIDDPFDQLTSRIDLVLLDPKEKSINWVMGTVVGDNMFNMTPSGLWPSDHGGVVTWISFTK